MPIIAGRASAAYGSGFGAVTTVPYAGPFGAYDGLGTVTVGASPVASVSFSGIPTGYEHLQIRWMGLNNDTASTGVGNVRCSLYFNGDDTATNYYNHFFIGPGGTPTSGNENSAKFAGNATRNSHLGPGVNIVDILDYNSTNKTKTVRTLTGYHHNDTSSSNQSFRIVSGLWNNISPISSIQIVPESGSFKQYSSFALYGVK